MVLSWSLFLCFCLSLVFRQVCLLITLIISSHLQSAFSMGGGGGMVGVTVATLPRRCHQQSMSDTQVREIMMMVLVMMMVMKVMMMMMMMVMKVMSMMIELFYGGVTSSPCQIHRSE